MQCCAAVRAIATFRNNKHPNFEWRGQGKDVDSLFSEVTLFEYNVSKIQFVADCRSGIGYGAQGPRVPPKHF